MFNEVQMAPADPILGLTEAFKKDPNPDKVNLGVGVYKDDSGTTPIMVSVKAAEEKMLKSETTKGYLAITGREDYALAVQQLVFGAENDIIASKRAVTAQTPGGTGALRVAGDVLKQVSPKAAIWVSDPTWANHIGVFGAAGLEIKKYPYYKAETKSLDFEGMMGALDNIPAGDVVLLHGCCHNPTGVDPSIEQWGKIAEKISERKLVPLADFAYQGLGKGIDEDASGIRLVCSKVDAAVITSSFSKNAGLYNERVGAITILCESADVAKNVMSQVKLIIRRNYSNPPSHGASIIATIMGDDELKAKWEVEVAEIRERMQKMRELFLKTLKAKGVKGDYSFITKQNGMFSFSGLNKEQVAKLRDKYSIYIVGSGRINVAGMTSSNMDRICSAIADVL